MWCNESHFWELRKLTNVWEWTASSQISLFVEAFNWTVDCCSPIDKQLPREWCLQGKGSVRALTFEHHWPPGKDSWWFLMAPPFPPSFCSVSSNTQWAGHLDHFLSGWEKRLRKKNNWGTRLPSHSNKYLTWKNAYEYISSPWAGPSPQHPVWFTHKILEKVVSVSNNEWGVRRTSVWLFFPKVPKSTKVFLFKEIGDLLHLASLTY